MGKNKVGNLRQIASINRYTFTEGKEEGIKVIDCDNGKIRFFLASGFYQFLNKRGNKFIKKLHYIKKYVII